MSKEITFAEFTRDWFLYESCPYIQSKLRRGGDYSYSHAMRSRRQLEMYMLPYFGTDSLIDIQPAKIEKWLELLKELGLSHISINHYFKTFKLILKEAYRLRIIPDNPATRVLPYIAKSSEKGILTDSEVAALFAEGAIETVWRGYYMHYLFNYTACQTGMRTGEILALRPEKVKDNYIIVSSSWDRIVGEKSTKTGKIRYVPVKYKLVKMLLDFVADRKYIFSFPDKDTPINHNMLSKRFNKALEAIGISNEVRKSRNITQYSWRHYRNTKLRLMGIPEHITRAIIGHQSLDMSEHYSHFQPEDLVSVLNNVKAID